MLSSIKLNQKHTFMLILDYTIQLMRKTLADKPSYVAKLNGKRLSLDRKQPQTILPNLKTNFETNENPKKINFSIPKSSLKLSSANKGANLQIISFLMRTTNSRPKIFNSYSKVRSSSVQLNSQKRKKQLNQLLAKEIFTKFNTKQPKQFQKSSLYPNLYQSQHSLNRFLEKSQSCKSQISNIYKTPQNQNCYFEKNNYIPNQIVNEKNQQTTQNTIFTERANLKAFQSVGVSTDLQMNTESYKEFIKFKITQKQKFHKLKSIFQFIDDISNKQNKVFEERYKKVNQLYNKSLSTDRQTNTLQLTQNISKTQAQFTITFDKYFKNQLQIQSQFSNFNISETKIIKQLLTKLKRSDGKHVFQSQSKCLLIQNLFNNLESKQKQIQQQAIIRVQQNHLQLMKKFQAWKNSLDHKNCLIQSCVNDILRLPEMSLLIFGFGDDLQTKKEVSVLEKIGVFLDTIPTFQKIRSIKSDSKQFDTALFEALNVKCFNCCYLKSKMNHIYRKNTQLKSVIKILNHLIQGQKQSSH